MFVHMPLPLISSHKYRSDYENNRLFRKPPSLGPPWSCANKTNNISSPPGKADVGTQRIPGMSSGNMDAIKAVGGLSGAYSYIYYNYIYVYIYIYREREMF